MKIHLLTPFPKMTDAIIHESILGRAEKKEVVKYEIHNLFDFADSPHYRIDDYPFGGSSGMVMKPEPVFRAFEKVKENLDYKKTIRVIYPTPDGKVLNQKISEELATESQLVFINGHYKGIDQRIRDNLVTDEISIGDYILTGGELASMVILDSIVRLIPSVLNSKESADTDSFSHPLLDGPYYTRPEVYEGMETPKILLSGHHQKVREWMMKKREEKTRERRPDLWKKYISSTENTE
jgi:tRNA (guanine37-N1)-methyltransferase